VQHENLYEAGLAFGLGYLYSALPEDQLLQRFWPRP